MDRVPPPSENPQFRRSPIRDDLDPGALVRVADSRAPCVMCGRLTTGRSTGAGGEPVHYACLYPKLWLSLARQRGLVETGGTYWSHK